MGDLQPRFVNRAFETPRTFPALKWDVNDYSHNAVGGPERASLTGYGSLEELFECIEMLRFGVELVTVEDEACWWGYVHAVTVRVGAVQVGVSLDAMHNRVRVDYTKISPTESTPAGTRASTDWLADADSVAAYGTKELRQSINDATTEMAEAARAAVLDIFKYPGATVEPSGAENSLSVTMHCRGWWETLKWVHYSQAAGRAGYTSLGDGTQAFGDVGTAKVGQSFEVSGSAWYAYSAKVRLKKTGTPTDTVRLKLCADSVGLPSTTLATATLDGATLTTEIDWMEMVFDAPTLLSVGVTYWLVVERSGAGDAANYYLVDVNTELGYTDGELRLYNGASWAGRTPDADMVFAVGGVQETTQQINAMIVAAGQFMGSVEIGEDSGVYTPQYRDGDLTAQAYVEELLKTGTQNGKRLLATVSRDRRVQVYEEPANTNYYYLRSDMTVCDGNEVEVNVATCPVGVWMKLKDLIPATADTSRLANPGLIFVEMAEYSPRQSQYRPTARNLPSPWDVAGGALRR